MAKHEAASDAAITYSLQYLLDEGSEPSRWTVVKWLAKLETLSEPEILRLHGDMNALKRFLRD